MLADLVDHVIGIDPAKSVFMAALVRSDTLGEVAFREFAATPAGYRLAIEWAGEEGASADSRVWAVEGSGSYGSGLTQVLGQCGEWAIEFSHPTKAASPDGAKSDRLDAVRAARESLGRTSWPQPRARGTREAIRALLVARDGAQQSRTRALNELKSLVITAPVEFRTSLDGLNTAALIKKCRRFHIDPERGDELAGTKTAMRALARRVHALGAEAADLKTDIETFTRQFAPQLLNAYGIGPICAAQIIVAWSHPGRFATDAAFCRFAGVSPILATSGGGDIARHRLNRRGDRTLNKALHTIAMVRMDRDPRTRAFISQQLADGRTRPEARRILKRYIARGVYRLLEHPPQNR